MTDYNINDLRLKDAAWSYQIKDSILLKEEQYDIERIFPNISKWFIPEFHDFNPIYSIPACWRGYQCDYVIKNKTLYLKTLNINDKDKYYPLFAEINPDLVTPTEYFEASYFNIFLKMNFTGSIIIVKNLTKKLNYKEKAELWMYEKIIKLYFNNGTLTRKIDISKKTHEYGEFKESRKDILRVKQGQNIFRLCCQWIEENKARFHCVPEASYSQNSLQLYLARKDLLTLLKQHLPTFNANTVEDPLLLEIITLCNQLMLSNLKHCPKSFWKRTHTKEQKLHILKDYLLNFYTPGRKSLNTYLNEKYPYPVSNRPIA